MFDNDNDDEAWRKLVPAKPRAKVYMGRHVTASQWAYLARKGDAYYLVFIQVWFRLHTITPVQATTLSDWDLPKGEWVPIMDTSFEYFEVSHVVE